MGTVVPGATRISRRTPAAGEGISASTLSVEISNRGSSRSTRSPTFLSHFVTVPSAIDSPIWGMMTSAMASLAPSRAYASIAWPYTASAACMSASGSVGWGWTVR